MALIDEPSIIDDNLKCKGCGATLHYVPGKPYMQCVGCGQTDDIQQTGDIHSFDYDRFVQATHSIHNDGQQRIIACNGCGSKTTFTPNSTAENCAFCSSPLVIEFAKTRDYVKPHYVLPFQLGREDCVQHFQKWLKGRYFAPNNLAAIVNSSSAAGAMRGIYLPYWMYDSNTVTHYNGERGEYYYTTESYQVNGEWKSREVRHTRWYQVSGNTRWTFTDILIPASKSLPEKMLNDLTPWNLVALRQFDERYISGFNAETFQLSPEDGLDMAKQTMQGTIKKSVLNDIGGDEQRILSTDTYYDNAIKYTLLPVWASSYTYKNKVYQFVINAYTGEVIGKHPYSVAKIVVTIFIICAIIFGLIYYNHH